MASDNYAFQLSVEAEDTKIDSLGLCMWMELYEQLMWCNYQSMANFNGGLAKLPLKLQHRWVITSCSFILAHPSPKFNAGLAYLYQSKWFQIFPIKNYGHNASPPSSYNPCNYIPEVGHTLQPQMGRYWLGRGLLNTTGTISNGEDETINITKGWIIC